MPSTPTWQALLTLAERLRTISVVKGYRTNLGATVITEPREFDRSEGPVIFVRSGEMSIPDDFKSRRLCKVEIDVQIEAHVPFAVDESIPGDATTLAPRAQQSAHEAVADIRQCLMAPDAFPEEQRGTCSFAIASMRVDVAPELSDVVVGQVTARVVLVVEN